MLCIRFAYKHWRQNSVFFIALFVGMSLSLIITPFLEDDCFFNTKDISTDHLSKSRSLNSDAESDEFEPRINLAGKPKKAMKTPQVLNRPRYYTSELGLRQKLFVGVLTSMESITSRGIALNKTVAHLVDKVMFFTDTLGAQKNNLSGVVAFTDARKILKPFHVLKYIADNYLNKFDYFFIVKDTVYIKAFSLYEVVKKISISEDVHMGGWKRDSHSAYCSLDGGVLLSSSVMQNVALGLDWCVKNAFSDSDDDNVGRCVVHSSNFPCMSTLQGQNLQSIHLESDFNPDHGLQELNKNAQIIFPIKEPETIYKLHKYFCEVELEDTQQEIRDLKASIMLMAPEAPGGTEALTWPVGSQETVKPGNRFDVLQWDFFTETQLFPDSDFAAVRQLSESEKLDIQQVINSSVNTMEHNYHGKLQYRRLVNGYRRYDPARGMDYMLDLAFRDKDSGLEVMKRVEVAKLLGKVEVIPGPYVTENSRVHMILPVEVDESAAAARFLQDYSAICSTSKMTCAERREKLFLLLVLLYDPLAPGKGAHNDAFGALKGQALALSDRQQREGMHIAWLSVKTRGPRPSDLALIDLASRKLPAEALVLMCTPTMNLRQDFLNRVRMNTIQQWQIFSPIPFSEYHPDVAYQDSDRPKELDINKKYGHYDSSNVRHLSFYMRDYMTARHKIEQQLPIVKQDRDIPNGNAMKNYQSVYSLFVRVAEDIHVLRAVEPSLRLWHQDVHCEPSLGPEQYRACQQSRANGLGTRAQLASLILQYSKQR